MKTKVTLSMHNFLQIQPESCRQRLPRKKRRDFLEEGTLNNWQKRYYPVMARIISYTPSRLYKNVAQYLNPFKRKHNSADGINLETLFPTKKTRCACGCNQKLTGKQRRWHRQSCSDFAWYGYAVIIGRTEIIGIILYKYYGAVCTNCGDMQCDLELYHTVPVFKGGGGCWLSNYKPLCVSCHKIKTKQDIASR